MSIWGIPMIDIMKCWMLQFPGSMLCPSSITSLISATFEIISSLGSYSRKYTMLDSNCNEMFKSPNKNISDSPPGPSHSTEQWVHAKTDEEMNHIIELSSFTTRWHQQSVAIGFTQFQMPKRLPIIQVLQHTWYINFTLVQSTWLITPTVQIFFSLLLL